MSTHRVLACAALAVVSGASLWLGCGGDDNASIPPAVDASVPDTSVNVGGDAAPDVAVDAGPPVCTPSLSGTPAWKPPTGYPKGACTHANIVTLFTDCTAPTYDKTKCDADKVSLADCFACINTPETAAALGPIVVGGAFLEVNYPGCLAIQERDASAGSCGGTQGVLLDCQLLACSAPCTALDAGTNVTPYDECAKRVAADGGVCATYAAQVSCPASDPAYTVCYRGATEAFQPYAERIASVFCEIGDGGAPPGDAGGDAASDAGDAGSTDAAADAADALPE